MNSTDISLTEKQRFWLEHVEACDASGQSMRAYAQACDLNTTAFYNWKSILRRKGALGESPAEPRLFQKAKVMEGRTLGLCRLVLPAGLTLEFDNCADPTWVAELVRVLAP